MPVILTYMLIQSLLTVTDTAIKLLLRICFTTLNDRVGSVTGSNILTQFHLCCELFTWRHNTGRQFTYDSPCWLWVVLFWIFLSFYRTMHFSAKHGIAIHRMKWRHCNLWSQYDLYVVGQHGVLCEVVGEDLWRYSNKIGSVLKENVHVITIWIRK